MTDPANPLLEGLRLRRRPEPCALVIFGASGDLTRRKLFPALYALAYRRLLPERFAVVGVARSEQTTAQFLAGMKAAVKQFARDPFKQDVWDWLSEGARYVATNFASDEGEDEVSAALDEINAERGTEGNRLYYLAIPPSAFEVVVQKIGERRERDGWTRVIVEKPFGRDLDSARELNALLHRWFTEQEIFRIDHYLGKETVQNMLALRFANGIFEPIWNRQFIDHVQITVAESMGIEGRAGFYEQAGVIRDIFQNHLLQLVALTAMEPPGSGEQAGPRTGDPRELGDFEQLWQAYTTQMNHFLERSLACIGAAERAWPGINPSPLLAGTFEPCIARGKDIGQGGPLYNGVGFVGAGLANACDSLLAVKKAVFEDRRFSMSELLNALAADFQGREPMRLYLLNRVPKWGNNHPEADLMGRRVAEHYCGKVHTFTNGRGGACTAALFTLDFALHGGLKTGALPDGRKAGESLAPGQGASYGRDRSGVTALMESLLKLDATQTPNGAVLDITLHPSAVQGDEGLDNLVALIKSYFARGGYALQFNVFDVETLRDAQRFPERYASLQVRVTGWSVYFTSMDTMEQNQYIARVTHGF